MFCYINWRKLHAYRTQTRGVNGVSSMRFLRNKVIHHFSYWRPVLALRVLLLPVYVCVCVRQSRACLSHNLWPAQVRITKLGPEHYNDAIMNTMESQITSLTIVYSTVYSRLRSTKTSKLRVTGLREGNAPVTGEFPAQMVSNAENAFIWWRHYGCKTPWVRSLLFSGRVTLTFRSNLT